MINLVTEQATKLRQGGTPDYNLVEAMETVRDEIRYRGAIISEAGERWPDQTDYSAYHYADEAIGSALNYLSGQHKSDKRSKKLTADTLDYLEKVEGFIS